MFIYTVLSTYSTRNYTDYLPSHSYPFSLHVLDPGVWSVNPITVEVFNTIILSSPSAAAAGTAIPDKLSSFLLAGESRFVLVFPFPYAQEKRPLPQLQGGDSWALLIYHAHSVPCSIDWSRYVHKADTSSPTLSESHFKGTMLWSFGQEKSLLSQGVYYLIGRLNVYMKK